MRRRPLRAVRPAEIQSVFGADCVAAREPLTPAELRQDEVLLYPILLPGRVELIYAVTAPGQARSYRRLVVPGDANRAKIAQLVARLVNSTRYAGGSDWKAPSRALYDSLIQPIEAELPADAMLVIVPDGPLRALPFAALTDGRFLVEKARISVAPALAYSQPGFDRDQKPFQIVAAALEREVTLRAGTFARLEGTAAEARTLVATSGSRRSRMIENFREADLRSALGGGEVDVLHLASHAAFNGRSDRSFIVADGEAIPIADLRRLIASGRGRGDELDLLVLSACETAVGDDQASMGLAGAAVQSGARSAIASLWEVSDAGTVELMKNFYRSYRDGESKAAALRNAQLTLIRQGGDFADPNVWAAFTLLGGWR